MQIRRTKLNHLPEAGTHQDYERVLIYCAIFCTSLCSPEQTDTRTHTKPQTLCPAMTGPCQQRAAGRVRSLFSQRKCVTAKCLSLEDDSIQAFTLALAEHKQGGGGGGNVALFVSLRACTCLCVCAICLCTIIPSQGLLPLLPPLPPSHSPPSPTSLFSPRRLQAHSIIGAFDCILD